MRGFHILQQGVQALGLERRNVVEAGEIEEGQLAPDVALDVVALLGGQAVPLVDRHHQRTPGFQDEAGQMRILLGNVLARVEHQHHHVGVLDRLQRLDDGEFLDRLEHFALAPHAGGVNQDVGLAVALELDIDRIARGARLVERDDALLTDQRVDQGRLADVGAPHQRDLGNAEFLGLFFLFGKRRQRLVHQV